jgi:replicative DNA helicase
MSIEQALIGAVLLGGSRTFDEVELLAADFFEPMAEKVWVEFAKRAGAGDPIDLISMGDKFPTDYLAKCTSQCPTVSTAVFYASKVREAALKRRLRQTGTMLIEEAVSDLSGDEVLESAYRQLDLLQLTTVADEIEYLPSSLKTYRASLDEHIINASSNLHKLDLLLNGFRKGALYVIGARPGVGKTVVGLQLAFGLARGGTKLPKGETAGAVAFFSLEMSKRELMNRLVAQVLEIPMDRLDRGNLRDDQKALIDSKMSELQNLLTINDRGSQSLASIRNYARSIKRQGVPLKAIVIDYLGLIADVQLGRNRYEAMTMVTGALKVLAKELDVPVIVLAQLNRNVEGTKDARPKMSDLRDSGSIEQDADVVILLHRDKEQPTHMELIVAKNRHGQIKNLGYFFEGEYSKITDSFADAE